MTQYLRFLPNVITIGRMVAVLPLMWLMWQESYLGALIIAVIAGISDGLDGFLAKRYGWQGWLGGVLDPLADKFMMLGCYTVFWLQGVVPWWLYLLIIGRGCGDCAGCQLLSLSGGQNCPGHPFHDQ